MNPILHSRMKKRATKSVLKIGSDIGMQLLPDGRHRYELDDGDLQTAMEKWAEVHFPVVYLDDDYDA